jgi:hypothetical protein
MTYEVFKVNELVPCTMYITFMDLLPQAQEEYLRFRGVTREEINETIETIAIIEREEGE